MAARWAVEGRIVNKALAKPSDAPVRQFKPYPAYKDSGVEWLGKIPAHWEVKPFKALLSRNDSGVWGEDSDDEGTIVLRSTEQTVDGEWILESPARRRLTSREASEARLEDGDLVVTKSSGSELHIGKTSIVDKSVAALNCCFSNFMQRLRVGRPNHARHFWYLLNCPVAREQLVFLSSTTTGLGNLNGSILGAIRVPVSPGSEQHAIATFLDRETARINALVAKKERLIELLQEKRTALIFRAVTKGLDPNVPMKRSGVPWLGEIPAHWEFGSLCRWWDVIDCKHRTVPFLDEGVALASIGEVQGLEVDLSNAKRTTVEEYRRMIDGGRDPRQGDVIYSRNATVGAAALATTKEPFCMGQDVSLIRSTSQDQRFLVFLLRSAVVMSQLEAMMVGSTFNRINVGKIKRLLVTVPPAREQREIGAFCSRTHERTQLLIDKNHDAIDRLKELRTTLISAAVTGKIDVREEVA